MSTHIRLGALGAQPYGPRARDIIAAVTADASCVGLWGTWDATKLTIASGQVTTFANFKSGGPTLTQATAARRIAEPAVVDLPAKRNVGTFVAASIQYYKLSTGIGGIDLTAAHTMTEVCKPGAYTTAQRLGAGSYNSATVRANLGSTATSQGYEQFKYYYGNSAATRGSGTDSIDPALWHGLIGSYDGSSLIPRLKLNGDAVTVGPAASGEPALTDVWGVSHATAEFDGGWLCAGLFTSDLLTDAGKATLLADVLELHDTLINGV